MSHSKGSWRKHRSERRGDRGKYSNTDLKTETVNVDCKILSCFSLYAAELDSKHDRYERIVKISRDITIESKRIIFLLHTIDKEDRRSSVFQEAETRLQTLESTLFKSVAKELVGEDPYMFLRAYIPGLQEYVEALTFYYYLKYNKLQAWDYIQKKLTYSITEPADSKSEVINTDQPDKHDEPSEIATLMPPADYILGVADLTGELMRHCINNLGSGQLESCMQTCVFVREIYNGFLGVGNSAPKEFFRKLYTLRQSLNKIENACYAIHVRGSEIPKNMLADVLRDSGISNDIYEEDEGFY